MNPSNSKLTVAEKEILREMRKSDSVYVLTDNRSVVIAYADAGNGLIKFATSIKSPDEKKFRFKVGDYHARTRLDCGEFAILPDATFVNMCDNETFLPREDWFN